MPLTPLHLGLGALFKGAYPARVSLLTFAASQALIDVEPAFYLLRGERPVHRFFHSIAGSLLVSAVAALGAFAARRVGERVPALNFRALSVDLSTRAIWVGAAVGGLSHVLLDWLLHSDIRLLYPSSAGMSAGGFVGVREMYLGCIVAGVIGLALLFSRRERAV